VADFNPLRVGASVRHVLSSQPPTYARDLVCSTVLWWTLGNTRRTASSLWKVPRWDARATSRPQLEVAARAQGISRAALIRRLLDQGLDQSTSDLESDLAAIEASFDVLSSDEDVLARGNDERSRHLDNVRRGR
jgi:hypothetical protein